MSGEEASLATVDLDLAQAFLAAGASARSELDPTIVGLNLFEGLVISACGSRSPVSGAITLADLLTDEWKLNEDHARNIFDVLQGSGVAFDDDSGLSTYDPSVLASAGIATPVPGTTYAGYSEEELAAVEAELESDVALGGGNPDNVDDFEVIKALGELGKHLHETLATIEDLEGRDDLSPSQQSALEQAHSNLTLFWIFANQGADPVADQASGLAGGFLSAWNGLDADAAYDAAVAAADQAIRDGDMDRYYEAKRLMALLEVHGGLERLGIKDLQLLASFGDVIPKIAAAAQALLDNPEALALIDTAGAGAASDFEYSLTDLQIANSFFPLLGSLLGDIDIAAMGGLPDGFLSEGDHQAVIDNLDLPQPVKDALQYIIDNGLYDEHGNVWQDIATFAGLVGIALFVLAVPASAPAWLGWAALGASAIELGAGIAAGDPWAIGGGVLGLVGPGLKGVQAASWKVLLGLSDQQATIVVGASDIATSAGKVADRNQLAGLLIDAGFDPATRSQILAEVGDNFHRAQDVILDAYRAQWTELGWPIDLINSLLGGPPGGSAATIVSGAGGPATSVAAGSVSGDDALPAVPPPPVAAIPSGSNQTVGTVTAPLPPLA